MATTSRAGRPHLKSSETPLCSAYDLAMLDLDGVVYVGEFAVDHAASSLGTAAAGGMHLAYVTNNASRTPDNIAAKLDKMGMPDVKPGDVVTSAQAAARLIAAEVPAGSDVLVVGGKGLIAALAEHGLTATSTYVEGETAGVVQGFHPDVSWRLLAEGTFAVAAGLPWIASNTDLSIPTPRGHAPGNGTLVWIIASTTGKKPIVAGKPEIALFRETLLRVGGERPIVVGDRLDTDIKGANTAGADSLLVFTGVTDLAKVAHATDDERPSYVAPDLRGLLAPQLPVEVHGDSAHCGEVVVHHTFGRVRVRDVAEDITSVLRATVALAWSYLDRGGDKLDMAQPQAILDEMMKA
ncbi:MAG: haloacid dehalogenase [Nocardioidaceae bacterium]|nr:haloacid dehalogenase [Nocardioidaceae bacterium]